MNTRPRLLLKLLSLFIACGLFIGAPAWAQPTLAPQPTNQVLREGKVLEIPLGVYGEPPFSAQWFHNSAAIPSATNAQLFIFNARVTNAGDYFLVVTNSAGAVTSSVATVTVTAGPTNPGAVDVNFAINLSGNLRAFAMRGDGRMLIGGGNLFSYDNGFSFSHLWQLNPDGSFDNSFAPADFDHDVHCITLGPDGSAYVGGSFTSVSGIPRRWLAKIETHGSLLSSFNAQDVFSELNVTGPDTAIESIGLKNGGGVIAVGFDYFSARLNPQGAADQLFFIPYYSAEGGENPTISFARLAQMHDGTFWVSRKIQNSGYSPLRVFPNGGSTGLPDVPSQFMGAWSFAELPGGNVLVGGGLYIDSTPQGFLRRALRDGSYDSSFVAATISGGLVKCIAFQSDGKILIGGTFAMVGGISRRGIARLNANGSLDSSFDPGSGVSGSVEHIALMPDGRVAIAGAFGGVDGVERSRIAVLHNDIVSSLQILSQPTNQVVQAGQETFFHTDLSLGAVIQWQRSGIDMLGATNATLYVSPAQASDAGDFRLIASNAFGVVTSAVATLTVLPASKDEGAIDVAFNSDLGSDDRIRAVARLADGKILVGGYFSSFNGVSRNGIARLLADGSVDPTFDPGVGIGNGPSLRVQAIAPLPDGKVIVGGSFTNFNGVNCRGIVRLNENGSVDSSFDAQDGASGGGATVYALAVQADGKVVVGGDFSTFQGFGGKLARLRTNGILDAFFPETYTAVYALAVQRDGRVLAGGPNGVTRYKTNGAIDNSFFTVDSSSWNVRALLLDQNESILVGSINTRMPVNRLRTNGWLSSSLGPEVVSGSSQVYALTRDECGWIYAAGSFALTNYIRHKVVRLASDFSLLSTLESQTMDGTVYALASAPETGGVLLAGDFANAGGIAARGIARLQSGKSAPVIGSISTNQTVAPGNPVSISVVLSNCPQPTVQWWLNGTPVLGATNATLSFAARPSRGGQYFVVLSNFAGMVTSSVVSVTIPRAPVSPGSRDKDFVAPDWIFERVLTIVEQSNRKIMLGGFAEQDFDSFLQPFDFPVMRLELDGAVDRSFQVLTATSGWGMASNLAVQADQRILVGGQFYLSGVAEDGFFRINTNGVFDSSFHPAARYAVSIVPHPDGRVTFSTPWGEIYRVTESGPPDSEVTNSIGYYPLLLLQPDGKYLAAVSGFFGENGEWQSVLKRFRGNGTIDSEFISPSLNGRITSLALQPDGKIVVTGTFTNIGAQVCGRIARFYPDGSLDSDFAAGTGANAEVKAIAIQPDGKIVLGGSFTQIDGVSRYGVARLLASGAVDLGFAPTIDPAFRVLTVFVGDLGRIYAGGAMPRGNGYYKGQVIRLHGDVFGAHPIVINGSFSLQTMTADGWSYHLERTAPAQPFAWTNVVTILGDGTPRTLVDPEPVSGSFYRVRVD